MKSIEINILRSVPMNRCNRDEFGSPKSATYGGTVRNYHSTQSQKRSLKKFLKKKFPEYFGIIQSRYVADELAKAMKAEGIPEELCFLYAQSIMQRLTNSWDDENKRLSAPVALSILEIALIAERVKDAYAEDKCKKLFVLEGKKKSKNSDENDSKKVFVCKKSLLTKEDKMADIGQIACFGRMMANDPELNVDGAVLAQHSLTVHESEDGDDYLIAVDELKPKSGSAHMNNLEYCSGCFYSYFAIDLDLFHENLSVIAADTRNKILDALIEGILMSSLPSGGEHTSFANTTPFAALILRREDSINITLADAFEYSIESNEGYKIKSRERLQQAWEAKKKAFGERLGVKKEIWFPDVSIDDAIKGVLA